MSPPIRTCLVIGPNASLNARQALMFMGLMGATSLGCAGFFAVQGFWPILPFAGLELLAVAAALAHSLHRNHEREVVRFDDDTIGVAFGEAGRGARRTIELSRSRTRVWLEPGPHRNSPTRLRLACDGRSVELGSFLTDEERERIAARMNELIHPGWRAAPVRRRQTAAWWLSE